MRTARRSILWAALAALPLAAAAQDAPDLSKWQCKLCKFEYGSSGAIEVGAGHVSKKSAKFGDYTGLDDSGGYFVGEASSRYRGANGVWWNVRASDIGLDSRSSSLEGGRQGSFRLFLDAEAIPRHLSDSAQSPFLGTGSNLLTLPGGFPAATTGLMPLAATLHPVDLSPKRNRIGLGASWLPLDRWQFDVSYRRDTRQGNKVSSGAFFVTAAQLVEPLASTTDQIDVSASYSGAKLQAKFAYYASRFRNDINALTWQNPFAIPAFPAATFGQLASAPDNQLHQISASLGYQFTERTRASADLAWGRLTQDDSFLAPTLNATLATPALPRSSLAGEVRTLNANLRAHSQLSDELRVNASYSHDDRDNQTPQAVYPWVTTDMFLGAPRANLPYGFTQDRVKLNAEYRYSPAIRAAAGLDHDWHKRTFQEVEKTRETGAWAKVSARPLESLDVSLKLGGSERRNTGYSLQPAITPPENPLLRKYNLANRSRETVGVRADWAATERIQLGLAIDNSRDRYRDSSIGLTGGRDFSVSGDISAALTDRTSLHAFGNYQRIEAQQAGSQAFGNPDWSAENEDRVDVWGFGLKHAAIKDKLDFGADYVYTRTRSAIRVATGTGDPGFPDFTTSLQSLKLYATYRVGAQLTLHGGYWVERYRSADWMLDGVTPATISNVLAFGAQPPQYRVNVIRVSARYSF